MHLKKIIILFSFQTWINADFDDDDDAFLKVDLNQTASLPQGTKRKFPTNFVSKPKLNPNDPWSSRHTPESSNNLAVQPKKIEELRNWFTSCLQTNFKVLSIS